MIACSAEGGSESLVVASNILAVRLILMDEIDHRKVTEESYPPDHEFYCYNCRLRTVALHHSVYKYPEYGDHSPEFPSFTLNLL